jgi:putative ABC transport system permease protein
MFTNYLKVTLRNMRRHKTFSFINIAGLAVGMACCLLIFLWVQDELSYDRFNDNYHDLYRLTLNLEGQWTTSSPWALAPVLKKEYPEILKSTRYAQRDVLVTHGEQSFYETAGFVDPDFFEMFTFPFVEGQPQTALTALQSAVITEGMSRKYFRNEDPVGKVLTINNNFKLTVTGIIRDVPSNSHLDFTFLAPVRLFGEETLNSWALESGSYVLLQKNISVDNLREKISGVVMKYDKRIEKKVITGIQPLSRIHLYSLGGGGSIVYIYIFSTIAVFILLIACVNFINLSTARAGIRAKEVGMRKVVGAKKTDIIRQFFGESLVLAFIALLFAVVLVLVFLPAFNHIAQKQLNFNLTDNIAIVFGLVGITLFTGIVSGTYPALFLSAFHPIKVLRGTHTPGPKRPLLRRVLVVFQFSVAVILVVGTFVVYKQLNYIRNKDLGFNREHIVSLPMNRSVLESYQSFKNELLQNPNVVYVTSATSRPTSIGNINPVYWEGRGPEQYEIMNFVSADYDYIKTFGMEIVAGRDFSVNIPTDRNNYIVNEEAVKFMGIEDPVGKLFSIWQYEGQILGVVRNFHSRSLHSEIRPLVITMRTNWSPSHTFIKIKPDSVPLTMSFLKDKWKKFAPNYPFNYLFLDDAFEQLYRTDQRIGTIIKYFTFLAIFISCLGLFGLASFSAAQRTKEIGIRKVLGATVPHIVALISREFIILITLANVIAWPVAYFIMNRMLDNYAYRTGLPWWIFLVAGVLAYGIALITVSFQTLKAAWANPAGSLKYE